MSHINCHCSIPEICDRQAPARLGENAKLLTIVMAAEALGIHSWALRRAVSRGLVPSYQGFNSRRLVRLSEVQAAVEATRTGGVE